MVDVSRSPTPRNSDTNVGGNPLHADLGGARRSVLVATMEYDIEDWAIKIKIGGLGVSQVPKTNIWILKQRYKHTRSLKLFEGLVSLKSLNLGYIAQKVEGFWSERFKSFSVLQN